jgi:hypothetical protein
VTLRPRNVAAIGLLSGALGAGLVLLLAIAGPQGLAGAGLVGLLSRLVVPAVGGAILLGAVVALVPERWWGVTLMLAAAVFLVGYMAAWLYLQGAGYWYPTR